MPGLFSVLTSSVEIFLGIKIMLPEIMTTKNNRCRNLSPADSGEFELPIAIVSVWLAKSILC
jgi:hypothetical protein